MKFLKSLFKEKRVSPLSDKFVDLAPTDEADEDGVYFEALDFATRNRKVFNIALTGPYGSGKSSIIRTFLKNYEEPNNRYGKTKRALQISLAAFVKQQANGSDESTDDKKPSKNGHSTQEIERSILQQMLYGTSANRLPLSRFKRIQKPKAYSCLVSLGIVVGCSAVWYLLQHKTEIVSGGFFLPFAWASYLNYLAAAIGSGFIWLVAHQIYVKSFGLSLKGVSLKDLEITPDAADKESILNRHLDEIIYFFQATDYELVIIEDLDRFDSPEIFVTLREINGLINSNEGVKRQVRFLYALRDDMFTDTDRTKFFEFIVPVVPIINHSNSIDKVLEQEQRLSLVGKLDPEFLREVSRHLRDLRLIRNIFNEYAIYWQNLERDKESVLVPDKLLAVLIYKNAMPDDFEALHRKHGCLAAAVERHDTFVAETNAGLANKIAEIEANIVEIKERNPKDLDELKKIYAMTIISHLPDGSTSVTLNGVKIPIRDLWESEHLGALAQGQPSLTVQIQNRGNQRVHIPNVESELDARMTFAERFAGIEEKGQKNIERAEENIRTLKAKMAGSRLETFAEVVRANTQWLDKCFENLGEYKELMKFLVLEGHLDDNYYQYISLFHEGRLSPRDDKFLKKIRAFETPKPDYPLDNVAEVIAEMRTQDFERGFVLNTQIFDLLLAELETYENKLKQALDYLAANFEEEEIANFVGSYYEQGREVPGLIRALLREWPQFPIVAVASERGVAHVARIIAYAPDELIHNTEFRTGPVPGLLSDRTREVSAEGMDFDLSRLKTLGVTANDLPSLTEFPKVLDHLVEHGLYKVNIQNIRYLIRRADGPSAAEALERSNYSTILKSSDEVLVALVETNFEHYLKSVLLTLRSNDLETEDAIVEALNHDGIAAEAIETYWKQQSTPLTSLNSIPQRHHHFALAHDRIVPTWDNIRTFLAVENSDQKMLTGYLQKKEPMDQLLSQSIPDEKEALPLTQFLINNDGLDDGAYRAFVTALPREFKVFPEAISRGKRQILIETHRVTFSAENLDLLGKDNPLKVLFIQENATEYFSAQSGFEIDDAFRTELLKSEISDDHKRIVLSDMDHSLVLSDAELAGIIGPILDRTKFDAKDFDSEVMVAIIGNTKSVTEQVSLLNRAQSNLTDDQVRSALRQMPKPFSEIAGTGKVPKIRTNSCNQEMAEWLDKRNLISSWSVEHLDKTIRINTFRK